MDLAGKKFLVVGGSGVLGRSLVSELHKQGAEVLASATSNESAANIPNVSKVRLLLDLTKPESVSILTSYLRSTETELDGLIVASGVVGFGSAGEVNRSLVEQMNLVNYLGVVQLISELLPLLRRSAGQGGADTEERVILNLTGVVASMPLANLSHYSASKTAIAGFLAALAKEERKSGIRVIDARPGHTETGLANRPLFGTAPNFGTGMTPEHVATRLVNAIQTEGNILEAEFFK